MTFIVKILLVAHWWMLIIIVWSLYPITAAPAGYTGDHDPNKHYGGSLKIYTVLERWVEGKCTWRLRSECAVQDVHSLRQPRWAHREVSVPGKDANIKSTPQCQLQSKVCNTYLCPATTGEYYWSPCESYLVFIMHGHVNVYPIRKEANLPAKCMHAWQPSPPASPHKKPGLRHAVDDYAECVYYHT